MAIPVRLGITKNDGGIKIDAHARVIDRAGAVIPGLYCAGAALGGLEGGDNVGYVGGLIKSTFGVRVAGHTAESFVPERRRRAFAKWFRMALQTKDARWLTRNEWR